MLRFIKKLSKNFDFH